MRYNYAENVKVKKEYDCSGWHHIVSKVQIKYDCNGWHHIVPKFQQRTSVKNWLDPTDFFRPTFYAHE